MITYDMLFRRFGVRLPQHLMTPIVATIDKFQFPKNSLFHAITFDGVHSGPASDELLFRGITKQILMDHVTDLGDFKGTPRKINAAILPYIREYHIKNRRYRYLKDLTMSPRDENTLLVLNYGFVPKIYRYVRSLYTEYYKWWNLEKTLWKSVNQTAKVTQRDQFVFVSLPKILPSVSSLNNYSKVFNSSLVKIFDTPESLFLLEVWKWLSEDNRENSIFSDLDKESLSKINIVFQESGSWVMINLGVLSNWRYVASEESDVTQKVRIEPAQLQRRFLRLLMTLMASRSMPVDPDAEPLTRDEALTETPEEHALDEETRLEKANRTLETMDDDLKELETIEKNSKLAVIEEKQPTKQGTIHLDDFHTEDTTEGSIVSICDKLAEDGLLTAAVYRNLVNGSKAYKTIKAPDGSGSLEDFIKVDPEVIAITESSSIKDIPTVLDKSMLKSSLLKFNEDYVEKVLAKDVAGMVVNVQKAGVILSDYNVEKVDDILGNYEIHTVRVRPVEGVASTLRFRLPVVDSNGVITYNNNKYKLRMQRGDNPLRKIGPDTVALTSYYGKTFIKRSPKRVNDYSSWLCSQVMAHGLDSDDKTITNLATATVFDNHFKCPRTYSILAHQFKAFTNNGYNFNFDHTKRESLFGKENVEKYETDSLILLASNDKGHFLAVDSQDAIYELGDAGPKLRGNIETVLGIDESNVPVEYSEIKIFGKNITIGFILAYQLGLTKLMELLKVEPRRVLAGQRLGLEAHEYAIAFSDTTLIFNKDDKLAAMILAGLTEYEKGIRKYAAAAMDKPNVYLNILESVGLGARYLREIDLFNNLFVDPITKELLIEMGEPTTVRGLLVRASELLLLDMHPDQLDMRYMRIKGYERLAGAVYSELVQSIRAHNARAGKTSKPLELGPYAVWEKIVRDPSMNMISDINPIENLKQIEAVTYSGVGGRSTRSMTKATREYHISDTGVISESTMDSSSVGVNIFTSADPQFKSLRGTTRPYVIGETGATALLSTSALISPGSDRDDPKRVKSS